MRIYIVMTRRADTISPLIAPTIESVWETDRLAEAAVKYYESINDNPQIAYMVIERELNTISKR